MYVCESLCTTVVKISLQHRTVLISSNHLCSDAVYTGGKGSQLRPIFVWLTPTLRGWFRCVDHAQRNVFISVSTGLTSERSDWEGQGNFRR